MKIQENISLKNKNTLGINCQARFYAEIFHESDLLEAIRFAQEKKVKIFILGLGSNVLLPASLNALVLVIKYQQFKVSGDTITLGAGNLLSQVILECDKNGFDLSCLAGFPSTIGGAVRGNAGLLGKSLGDFLENAVIFDLNTGKKEVWKKEDFDFAYRFSVLKKHPEKLFWEGVFTFPKGKNEQSMAEIIKTRWEKQPQGRSAGCFFKNPEGHSAGLLIDQTGLKGMKIGGAQISEKHANFFMNTENASPEDFLQLIQTAQTEVKKKFGVDLELEVQVVQL